ncbi:MAG: hypothetical protein ACI81T_004296 [Bacteroidia bacterium]
MPKPNFKKLKQILDPKVLEYNQKEFVKDDPISIPHKFTKLQDIEIMAFWSAMLAWGKRITIINKSEQLVSLMDNAPHDFMLNHEESDLKRFLSFKHRTFNDIDTLYFLAFFKHFYSENDSLETAFSKHINPTDITIENGLVGFHNQFFSLPDFPARTKKHVATPARKSACKRICMFLRWMVRQDEHGVDFGLWSTIKPSQLVCPLDVHVERVARSLNLITRKQTDWQTALELTANLRKLDKEDPVKYDFGLFGMGLEKAF